VTGLPPPDPMRSGAKPTLRDANAGRAPNSVTESPAITR
jgi:hypothetical protein